MEKTVQVEFDLCGLLWGHRLTKKILINARGGIRGALSNYGDEKNKAFFIIKGHFP